MRATGLCVTIGVVLSFGTLAQTEIPASDAELKAIYWVFEVTPDDPEVLEIRGLAVPAGDFPRHLIGYLTKSPYPFAESMCVLETLRHSGDIIGSDLVWESEPPSKTLKVWLSTSANSCEVSDVLQLPAYVDVFYPTMSLGEIMRILQSDNEIYERASDTPEGQGFREVAIYYRMSTISSARKDLDRDLGDYCVKYDVPGGASMGPSICFEFEDDELVLKSVGHWIS